MNSYTQIDGSTTWFYAFIQEGGFGFTNNPPFPSRCRQLAKLEI